MIVESPGIKYEQVVLPKPRLTILGISLSKL